MQIKTGFLLAALLSPGLVCAAPAVTPAVVVDDGIPFGTTLTTDHMIQLTQKVADTQRRDALALTLQQCVNKAWLACHVAIYDLENYGLVKTQDISTGLWTSSFGVDIRANRVLDGITSFVNKPENSPEFNIQLKSAFDEFGVPTTLDYSIASKNSATKESALRMAENHYRFYSLPVNMRVFISKRRGEFIRMLTHGYALRGDSRSAYQGLEMLNKYAKMNNKDAWVVKHTYDTVVKVSGVIQQKQARKQLQKTDQIKDIKF